MFSIVSDCLAASFGQDIARFRLASMLAVLVGGLFCGYLAGSHFGLPESFAKKIMTVVLVCFSWLIALLVIWRMQLTGQLIWLPIVGLILMLVIIALSAVVFSLLELDRRSRLTLVLAGGLSNVGYTGGAFVCYALFGAVGLAMANVFLLFSLPTFYLIFLPLLKIHALRTEDSNARFEFSQVLDLRFLVIPAVMAAVILNFADVKPPDFIMKFYIIDILVYLAASLSFFAIGLQVKLSRFKNYISLYFLLGAVKFILTPALAILIIWLLALTGQNLTGLVQKVIIILSASPSAVLMVTMSNVFDLDGPLASALWVVTTAIFVVIVVPVLFFIFA